MLKKDKTQKKTKKKWTRFRHDLIVKLVYPFFWFYILIKYNHPTKLFKLRKRQYLVLMNHQTSADQFFVGLTFGRAMYYVATEDIFSNGLISELLRYAINPIPINKTISDYRAVINCMKVAKEGGSIVLAPEGNRTFSGRTCSIKPTVVGLIRKLGLPIAFFRIEGGYGVQPRWSDKNRRGKIDYGISGIIEPSDYSSMTDDELYKKIVSELSVDEARPSGLFKSRFKAEHIERVLYICPNCGFSSFISSGDRFICSCCNTEYEYSETKELIPIDSVAQFRYLADWYDWQEDYIRNLDLDSLPDTALFTDIAKVFEVILYKKKVKIARGSELKLFKDKITVKAFDSDFYMELNFSDIKAITAMGRKKMNVRTKDCTFQFKGDASFNIIKYMHFYYHYINQAGGNNNVDGNTEFLGL